MLCVVADEEEEEEEASFAGGEASGDAVEEGEDEGFKRGGEL